MAAETATAPRTTTSWGLVFALGIVMIISGALLLGTPLLTAVTLAGIVGLVLAVLGVAGIVVGIKSARPSRRATDLLLGMVTLIVGIYCMAYPLEGAVSLALAVGIWLVIRGVLEFASALRDRDGTHRALLFVSAAIDVLLGVLLIANYPFEAVGYLGILLAVSLIFAGFSTIIGAFGLRRLQER